MIEMEYACKTYEELTKDEFFDILALRQAVFVVEQHCAYLDLDEKDKKALHLFLTENGKIIAYLRLMDKGVNFKEVSFGRVISKIRRCGIGSKLLDYAIKEAKDRYHASKIEIEAQTYAKSFYEKAGFVQDSEEFLEDGIPHIHMTLVLS